MKKKRIAILTISAIFLLAGASASLARGYGRGYDHYGHGRYHPSTHHHGGHDGLGIVLGVAGGILVGSAIYGALQPPPPPAIVYTSPPPPPVIITQAPRVCYQDQVLTGQYQMDRGRQIWVPYQPPVSQRIQVPCN
ncbi:MAG: hypothetical protein ACK5PS_16800 [Desulfopila sp.]